MSFNREANGVHEFGSDICMRFGEPTAPADGVAVQQLPERGTPNVVRSNLVLIYP